MPVATLLANGSSMWVKVHAGDRSPKGKARRLNQALSLWTFGVLTVGTVIAILNSLRRRFLPGSPAEYARGAVILAIFNLLGWMAGKSLQVWSDIVEDVSRVAPVEDLTPLDQQGTPNANGSIVLSELGVLEAGLARPRQRSASAPAVESHQRAMLTTAERLELRGLVREWRSLQ